MYYIYMVRCDDSLYTGITKDVERRMREHVLKLPQAAAYTKSRNVFRLEALWSAKDRSSVMKLQYRIKQLKEAEKEILLKNPDVFENQSLEEIHLSDLEQFKDQRFNVVRVILLLDDSDIAINGKEFTVLQDVILKTLSKGRFQM